MYYADQLTNSPIAAFPGKHIDYRPAPRTQAAFVKMAIEERKHARNTQKAFLSYQTALEDQEAFSKDFYTSERDVTWNAVTQLEDVREELTDLLLQIASLATPTLAVPEEMQVDLDYARSIAAHHRNVSFENHVFYKVNWSLAINHTGLIPLKRLWIPDVHYYLNNKWQAQYWAHPVTPEFAQEHGFTQFLSNN